MSTSDSQPRGAALDPDPWADHAADQIEVAVLQMAERAGGPVSLMLAGGTTPRPVYRRLARSERIPWSGVEVFFGDERCVPAGDARSNYLMARESLLDRVEVRAHRMEAERPDRDAAADEYAALLPERISVLLLGIGEDGHVASLFPGSPALDEWHRRVVPVTTAAEPRERLTVTPPVIEAARRILVLARGNRKAGAVAQATEGPTNAAAVSDRGPQATILACPARLARRGIWLVDAAAAAKLGGAPRAPGGKATGRGSRVGRSASSVGAAHRVLAADVGGTHTRLATFAVAGTLPPLALRACRWPSAEHVGLAPVIEQYLADEDGPLEGACVAVAGPVRDGVSTLPNLGWEVRREALARVAGVASLLLVNDFQAIGHGLPFLGGGETAVLQEGRSDPQAPAVILGPGTGLGVAWIEPESGVVRASEGGHADFAPWDDETHALARALQDDQGRVSWEDVVSGRGLVAIHRALGGLMGTSGAAGPTAARAVASGGGPSVHDPAEISRRALAGDDARAVHALELFVSALGAFARNTVLTMAAWGGIHIAGGIAPEILGALREGPFLPMLREGGGMRALLERVPVRVVVNVDVGLLGAASLAWRSGSRRTDALKSEGRDDGAH